MAQQNTEKKFATGVFIEEKTFDWGTITKQSYKVDEFIKFLQENKNDKGYVNIDVKKSKDGSKMYGELNTYLPKPNNNVSTDNDLPF